MYVIIILINLTMTNNMKNHHCYSTARILMTNIQRSHSPEDKGFPGCSLGKESASQCRRYKRNRFDSGVRKIPWRREWLPTPVFLPGKSQGQRSLVGYSPWGCKESDTVEQLSTAQHHLYQPPAAIQLPSRQRWSFQREAVPLSSITIYPERRLPRSTLGGDEGVQVVD